MICDYGCNQEAKYHFPTVDKWCCSSHFSKCPKRIDDFSGKNNPMYNKPPWSKGKTGIYSEETLQKIRAPRSTKGKTYEEIHGEEKAKKLKEERSKHFSKARKGKAPWNKGKKNIYSKSTIDKIKKARTYNIEDYKKKHPEFYELEKPTMNNGVLIIKCKLCGKDFSPSFNQLHDRLKSIKKGIYKSFFYCSDLCKDKCQFFDRKVDLEQLREFKKYNALVYRETRKTLQNNEIKNIELRGKKHKYELDHKYSIYDGFINNIPPKTIAHPQNLQIITMKENRRKKSKSSISKETLLSFK